MTAVGKTQQWIRSIVALFSLGTSLMGLASPGVAFQSVPARCSFQMEAFDCKLEVRSHGFAFDLPNGQTLVLTYFDGQVGTVFLDQNNWEDYEDPEGAHYQDVRPKQLGDFYPVPHEPGCWIGPGKFDQLCITLPTPSR